MSKPRCDSSSHCSAPPLSVGETILGIAEHHLVISDFNDAAVTPLDEEDSSENNVKGLGSVCALDLMGPSQ